MTTGRHIERYRRNDGKWSYRVIAGNGQIVSTPGQGFATKWGAGRSARREHPGVTVVDRKTAAAD